MQTEDRKALDCCQPDWDFLEGRSVSYALALELDQPIELTVGRKGTYAVAAGSYLYVGSARRNAKHRLRRHWQGDGRLKWHIDYLRREARCCGIWLFDCEVLAECELAALIAAEQEITIPIARFGASDCHCPAHLFGGAGMNQISTFLQNLAGFFYSYQTKVTENET
ncbi:MAG: GIY-YIG nuclease family protein [Negativicutes bacterium]|nr:GIY-YIG nuclease family protein [Negativicutes bacterium]